MPISITESCDHFQSKKVFGIVWKTQQERTTVQGSFLLVDSANEKQIGRFRREDFLMQPVLDPHPVDPSNLAPIC